MEVELINKISNLTFGSYFNESLNMVVVHFFNKDSDKPDIISYLKPDMSWDVREIVDESSELDVMKSDGFYGEDITITHEPIGVYAKGSNFDNFIRISIHKMSEEGGVVSVDEYILDVLKNNSYEK